MSLIKYDPFRGLESITKRLSSFLNQFEPNVSFEFGSFVPKVDISEDEKYLKIQAEMPGLSKDDFKVTITDDNMLCIKGSKKKEKDEKEEKDGRTYHRIERSYGEFSRSFLLPDYIKNDSIQAKYEDGVLNITFEKTEPVKPKEIQINVQ